MQQTLTTAECQYWQNNIRYAISCAKQQSYKDRVPSLPSRYGKVRNPMPKHLFSGFDKRFSNWLHKFNSLYPANKIILRPFSPANS